MKYPSNYYPWNLISVKNQGKNLKNKYGWQKVDSNAMMCLIFHVSFFSLNYKTKHCYMQRLLINRLMLVIKHEFLILTRLFMFFMLCIREI